MPSAGREIADDGSLRARASLALSRRHLHRARDLADFGINRAPEPAEAAELLFIRTRAELGLGLSHEASASARRALALAGPEHAEAHGLAGAACARLELWTEAVTAFERALELNPNCAAWHAGAASALLELGEEPSAAERAHAAIGLDETNVDAALVLGRLALRAGRPAEAALVLAAAAEREPERAEVRTTLGVALAAAGDFLGGLREYEWRQRLPGWNPRRFDIPPWSGQDLAGKRLLVWSEQGLGDSLQFARFAASARERGAFVIFHGEPRLVRLFRSCDGFDEIHSLHAVRPPADFQASLLSLPALLATPNQRLSEKIPYLAPEPARASAWRERLALLAYPTRRLRVGLAWQGNPAFCDDERRSMALAHLLPLLREHGRHVELISLQKGFGQDQLQFVPSDVSIHDLGGELDSAGDAFVDTAAVLGELDLVLSTDTAIAHLAGALGRPVWTLLASVADWRWGVAGTSTAWYPTMRLFRQTHPGDWPGVVAAVDAALGVWIDEHRGPSAREPRYHTATGRGSDGGSSARKSAS